MSDATKVADAFLKIASVYKEENDDVKFAVLDSIGVKLSPSVALIVVRVFADRRAGLIKRMPSYSAEEKKIQFYAHFFPIPSENI